MSSAKNPLWDIPTRVCHWLFVIVVGFSWWSAENDHLDWHTWSGYALLVLVTFRIVWGFVGSQSARFSYFLRSPTLVWAYAKSLLKRETHPSKGHNPMGAWSVVLLLSAILIQVVLGLFTEDVDGLASGPLSYLVSYDTARLAAEVHEEFFSVLMLLVTLHIVFIFYYLFYKRENLIKPMLTGVKANIDSSDLVQAPLWRAALILLVIIAGVWWLVS